ncbi:MAG: NAD-dependent DNA ligase LigA [Lachnospiraceae bacterium]|nr:NAD-dependent DNA ligase LigA [Lachnospiraceae bacterium]
MSEVVSNRKEENDFHDKVNRVKELVSLLNQASKVYYQDGNELMSNFDYDKLYDELVELEKDTGFVMSNSPTINVGYEVLSELPKERHESPMLSLDKTKEVEALADFIKGYDGVISWKLDGLTVVLTYREGNLLKAVTRGNGEIGEVITNNAKVFQNIPLTIPYKGELILRGEAVIKYSDFEKINDSIEDVSAKYKNPRNLCSGSVRQLSNEITAKRNVNFFAFALIKAEGVDFGNSILGQFAWLKTQGFEVVEHYKVTSKDMAKRVAYFAQAITKSDFPSDGLVLMFDDIAYGNSLGRTAKFPRNGIAFKWKDETAKTTLKEIEWSASRTGLINPVAIFEPVELEGTTVSRASIHNVSVARGLELGIGDEIEVYKANMIIPQIAENHTRSGLTTIPCKCPVCGEETIIKEDNGFQFLYCVNKECPAKKIKRYTHFAGRNAMNIEGMSEETMEKFVDSGYIREFADLYKLSRYEEEIVGTKGFGQKSFDKLMAAIDQSRTTESYRVIYGLGILNIGVTNAKMLCKAFHNDLEQLLSADREKLMEIDGVGEIIADSFTSYFEDENNRQEYHHLMAELTIVNDENEEEQNDKISGKTFVITGSVHHFANRDEVKQVIEKMGGKVTGSVTKKTDYLINNDVTSSSSKNKKAKELGIPIITEEEFLAMAGD